MHHLEVDVVSVSPSPQICMMIFSPFLVISTSVNGIAAHTRETQAPGPSFWQVRVQWGSTAVSQVSPPHTLTPAVPWSWTCLTSKSVFVSVCFWVCKFITFLPSFSFLQNLPFTPPCPLSNSSTLHAFISTAAYMYCVYIYISKSNLLSS